MSNIHKQEQGRERNAFRRAFRAMQAFGRKLRTPGVVIGTQPAYVLPLETGAKPQPRPPRARKRKRIRTGEACQAAFPDCQTNSVETSNQHGALVSKRRNVLDVTNGGNSISCRLCGRGCGVELA